MPDTLLPVNRYLTITPHFPEKKTQSGVYLPDEFVTASDKHVVATVHSYSQDCSENLQALLAPANEAQILVDSSMIEAVTLKGEKHYVVLENYVIAALGTP